MSIDTNFPIYHMHHAYFIRSAHLTPAPHEHFASHLIFGLQQPFLAEVDGCRMPAVGIAIGSGISHTIYTEGPALRAKLEQLLEENRREEILKLYRGLAEQEPLFRWSISCSNYAYGTSDVYEYLQKMRAFSIRPIADQIQQDVLLISARKDMLVDFSLYRDEIDLLSNARSLTFYVPGAPLFGEAHCNIRNPQLIMDTILTWQDDQKHR